jgi:threonine/homoserine/homoserine lactone efflux protein
MPLELYLAFIASTAVLILIPGPAVALIVANALAHGTRGALISVAGVSTAVVGQLIVVGFGMASAMALLAEWFEWLRWAGVAYLVYLGVRQWRAAPIALGDVAAPKVSRARLYWTGVIVNATNPKTLFFYAAFFPQFIDPLLPHGPQIAALCVTFLVVQTLLDGSYALLGGRLRPWLVSRARARLRNRVTGSLLIGAGLGLALARRG